MKHSPDDPHDEPARDAWLSEALRHAPDADAAPPAAVRETILRQARAAAASATPRQSAGPWQRFDAAWSWLSGPRAAAAFASVMVATVIGLMWWDRPIDEALRPSEPPTPVAAPAAAPEQAPPAPAAADARSAAPRALGAEPPRDLAAAPPPRAAPQRKREAPQRAEPSNDAHREAAAAPAPAPAPEPAQTAMRADGEARALADARASADKETRAIDAARERRTAAAQEKAAAPALRSAQGAAAGPMHVPAPAAAPAPAPPAVAAAPMRQPRSAPFGALLEALAEDSPRWRWQLDGADVRALTPQLQAWLQSLDRAIAGRAAATDPAASAPASGSVQELRLLRDGTVQAVVRIGADGRVHVDIAGEAPRVAQLAASNAAALRRAFDDATR